MNLTVESTSNARREADPHRVQGATGRARGSGEVRLPAQDPRSTVPDPAETQVGLLARLQDKSDADAWEQFDRRYRPLAERHLRRAGLPAADIADVVQDVFHAVIRAMPRFRYDRRRGRFRSWFAAVVRSKLNNFRRALHRQQQLDLATVAEKEPAPPADSLLGGQEERQREWRWLRDAMSAVRAEFQRSTWRAFWLTTLRNLPVQDVAARLGMSVGAVYIARSRVRTRIREEVQRHAAEPSPR